MNRLLLTLLLILFAFTLTAQQNDCGWCNLGGDDCYSCHNQANYDPCSFPPCVACGSGPCGGMQAQSRIYPGMAVFSADRALDTAVRALLNRTRPRTISEAEHSKRMAAFLAHRRPQMCQVFKPDTESKIRAALMSGSPIRVSAALAWHP